MFDVAFLFVKNDNVVSGLRLLVTYFVVCPDDNYSISPMHADSFRFGVTPVNEHLEKYKEVDGDLDYPANPKLNWSFSK